MDGTDHQPGGGRRDALALVALGVMALLPALLPALLGRTVVDEPHALDVANQWVPFSDFIRACYLDGHFPLWDPHDLCGTPFLAFAHTGSLYPPGVLARLGLGPYHRAWAVEVFFHLALAAVAAYGLLRGDGRTRTTAFVGAVAYAFSGFVFGNINFVPTLRVCAFLPLWLAASFRLLERPRWLGLMVAAGSLTAIVLAGDLETAIFAGMALLLELGLKARAGRARPAGVAALAGTLVLGLLLAGALALPTLEFNHLSIRGQEDYMPTIPIWPALLAPLRALWHFPVALSKYPANHGLDSLRWGGFLVLLIAWGVTRPGAERRRLWLVPLFAVYLILVYVSPFNLATHRLPILGDSTNPFRLLPVLELFILRAALPPLDDWIRKGATAGAAARPLGPASAGFILLYVALAPVLIWFHHRGWPLLLPGLHLLPTRPAWRELFALLPLSALALAGAAGFWPRLAAIFRGERRRQTAAVAAIVLDVYLLALAYGPMTPIAWLNTDPRLDPLLRNSAPRERFAIIEGRGIIDAMLPFHLGLRLNADGIDAFSRTPPANSARRLGLLYPSLLRRENDRLVQYDQLSLRDPRNLDPARLDLLNQMNVAWIITRSPWRPPGTGLNVSAALEAEDLHVYRNAAVQPRARWRDGQVEGALPLARPAPDRLTLGPATPGGVALPAAPVEYAVSESWYPGWRAFQGKTEARLEADGLGFMKLGAVDPKAIVELRFVPYSFRLGLWIGLASIASFVTLAAGREARSFIYRAGRVDDGR